MDSTSDLSCEEIAWVYRRREVRQNKRSSDVIQFSSGSIFALVCLAVTLLLVPLIVPSISPPPLVLLLVPIGIMAVLLILAFMHGDISNATVSLV
ncbi:hypothetical protein SUGI_0237160 [Cryptomeria japonica]|nr:hypothetical protein SUGI_0237160 [Cryptomeria japonica]